MVLIINALIPQPTGVLNPMPASTRRLQIFAILFLQVTNINVYGISIANTT